MGFRHHAPLDSECPDVQEFHETALADPMTVHYGIGDELSEDFERQHRVRCGRCREYGAANIEVA